MPQASFLSKVAAHGFDLVRWCQRCRIRLRLRRQKAQSKQQSNTSAPESETSQNRVSIWQQLSNQPTPSRSVPDSAVPGDQMPRLPASNRDLLPEDYLRVIGAERSTAAGYLEPSERFPAHRPVSNCPEENLYPLPPTLPTQPQLQPATSAVPHANGLQRRYFWPANPALLGYIKEPEGSLPVAGGYSDVWRCGVQFSRPSEALPTEVAVKVLQPALLHSHDDRDANARLLHRFQQEAITWLGAPNHPNIVPLVGWILTPSLSLISPWYKQGNLSYHLKKLSETQRTSILLGIAKGLDCLHSCNPPIVHGDLKPENILLSDWGEPLLADFGLSTILGEEGMYSTSHGVGGSVRWMSPEQMVEGSRSCQSDIYSFGTLAFTVLTGELPHPGLLDVQIMHKVCNSSSPNNPVEDWDKYPRLQGAIGTLLQECWSRLPEARPTMSAIVLRLTSLLRSLES